MDFIINNLIPYFQPILSADKDGIYSYEVLGRYVEEDGTVKSLGPFFCDKNTTNEDALMVDRIIRRKAMQKFAEEATDEYLFINIRLGWITRFADNLDALPTVQFAREFEIPFDRLVIEITEDEFYNESEEYAKAIEFYKSLGCRIAIDDYGKDASNIDRLSSLAPDIVKIDMEYVHRSEESYYFREYLRMITAYADRVGIEVLFEGTETQKQLDICTSSNGKYFQGFLLAKPQPSVRNAEAKMEIFTQSFDNFIERLQARAQRSNEYRDYWDRKVGEFFESRPFGLVEADLNKYISELCAYLPERVKRVYICDKNGYQRSHNAEKNGETVEDMDCYNNKNWAWRGYFQEAVKTFGYGIKSYLTSEYRDVTTKEKMCTYIKFMDSGLMLHVDIRAV
jgi:EAL domain-containing protein (putative c-di-GMP-specific phosphodiesterase class I)